MYPSKGIYVAILRAPESSLSSRIRHEDTGEDYGTELRHERIEACIEMLRLLITEVVEKNHIPYEISEFQYHETDKGVKLKGKRFRELRRKNVLAAVDPSPAILQRLLTPSVSYPFRKGIVGFSEKRVLEGSLSLLASQRIPLGQINESRRQYAQTIYPLLLPFNEDDLARSHEKNYPIVENALTSPIGKIIEDDVAPALKIIDAKDPIAKDIKLYL